MSITCDCGLLGLPWRRCNGCTRSEYDLAVTEKRNGMHPYAEALAEEQPVAEEESADG